MYKQTHLNALIGYIVQTTHHLCTSCVCLELSLLQCIACVTPYLVHRFHVKGVFLSLVIQSLIIHVQCNVYCFVLPLPTCVSWCTHSIHHFVSMQGAASVAPEAASFQHPIEETTRDSSTGGSSHSPLVCMFFLCLSCFVFITLFTL